VEPFAGEKRLSREPPSPTPPFDSTPHFKTIDFHKQPGLWLVGKGTQRMVLVEPYKKECLTARES
jgi:hypothetical protein